MESLESTMSSTSAEPKPKHRRKATKLPSRSSTPQPSQDEPMQAVESIQTGFLGNISVGVASLLTAILSMKFNFTTFAQKLHKLLHFKQPIRKMNRPADVRAFSRPFHFLREKASGTRLQ